jgi:hypothetical protein
MQTTDSIGQSDSAAWAYRGETTMVSYRKVGGIHFFRVGQIGWSAYRTQRHAPIFPNATLAVAFWVLATIDMVLVIKLI